MDTVRRRFAPLNFDETTAVVKHAGLGPEILEERLEVVRFWVVIAMVRSKLRRLGRWDDGRRVGSMVAVVAVVGIAIGEEGT